MGGWSEGTRPSTVRPQQPHNGRRLRMLVGDIAEGRHEHQRHYLTGDLRQLLPEEVNVDAKLALTPLARDQLVVLQVEGAVRRELVEVDR